MYDLCDLFDRCDGTFAVGTIDEQMSGKPVDLSKERDIGELLFGDSASSYRAYTHCDEWIESTGVIVEIDGGSFWI